MTLPDGDLTGAETDATPGYRQARIDLIRTHDAYGPGDIDATFPDAPNTLIDGARTALSLSAPRDLGARRWSQRTWKRL